MRRSSQRKKRLWCYSCGKVFLNDDELTNHMESHSFRSRNQSKCKDKLDIEEYSQEFFFTSKSNNQKKKSVKQTRELAENVRLQEKVELQNNKRNVINKLPKDRLNNESMMHLYTDGTEQKTSNNYNGNEQIIDISTAIKKNTDNTINSITKKIKPKRKVDITNVENCNGLADYVDENLQIEEHTGSKAASGKPLSSTTKVNDHLATREKCKSEHKCDVCSKSFSSAFALYGHKQHHKKSGEYTCSFGKCCKTFSSKWRLSKHMKCHQKDKTFYCKKCVKVFRTNTHLRNHERTHTGEKPFLCDVCSKTFSQAGNLHMHKKLHTDDRRFCCEVCGKRFIQKIDLKCHMYKHTKEKPYSCRICGKKYGIQVSLKYHMKTHQPRPYQYRCKVCDQDCMTLSFLNTHMKYHSGVKPFSCPECGKSFTMAHGLKRHSRMHGNVLPYQCSVCSKSYKYSESLRKHMTKHVPGEKFMCELCDKTFPYKSSLRQHQVIHSGLKAFKCKRCDKAFNLKGNLKKHLVKCPLTKEMAVQCGSSIALQKCSTIKSKEMNVIQMNDLIFKKSEEVENNIEYSVATRENEEEANVAYIESGEYLQPYDDAICSEIIVPMSEDTIIVEYMQEFPNSKFVME